MGKLLKKKLKSFNIKIINYRTYQDFEGIKKNLKNFIHKTSKNKKL